MEKIIYALLFSYYKLGICRDKNNNGIEEKTLSRQGELNGLNRNQSAILYMNTEQKR